MIVSRKSPGGILNAFRRHICPYLVWTDTWKYISPPHARRAQRCRRVFDDMEDRRYTDVVVKYVVC